MVPFRSNEKYYQLLNNVFNKFSKRVIGVLFIKMMNKLSNNFSIRVALEFVTLILKEYFHFLVVGYDTVMYNNKTVSIIGALRVGIHFTWNTMRCPTRVSNTTVDVLDSVHIQFL